MKADVQVTETFSLSFGFSGAEVLKDVFRYSKTIGQAVAAKKGLTEEEADAEAAKIQRTIRRARQALEEVV